MPKKRVINIASSAEELSRISAAHIADYLGKVLSNQRKAFIALSGGSTPLALFQVLVRDYKDLMDWNRIRYFWTDERYVPFDHPDHNGKMAMDYFLSPLQLKGENIFLVDTTAGPHLSALNYEKTIREQTGCINSRVPVFDLVLLGLGQDGHIASLFPGSKVLEEQQRLVVADWVEVKKSWRITFTLPLINHAAHVLFLVAGQNKAEAVYRVIEQNDKKLPASCVKPIKGDAVWFVDTAAASLL